MSFHPNQAMDWPHSGHNGHELAQRLDAARRQLDAFTQALPADGWLGPRAEHLNPPLWEYGHIVWFQERWCLRWRPDSGLAPSRLAGSDDLYESSRVAHDRRWDLALAEPDRVRDYGREVLAAVIRRLRDEPGPRLSYLAELALYHELMHLEAWWMAWQALGHALPAQELPAAQTAPLAGAERPPAQLAFAAGEAMLGSTAGAGFIFDNEKWAHPVPVAAFEMDARPASEMDYLAFVADGGYARPALWSPQGRAWLATSQARHPLYWRPGEGGWQVREFARWRPLDPARPLRHVNRHEAEAYAAWRGRRLPLAGEWLRARDHSDWVAPRAWEWLAEPFLPYPGFSPDPYADYSQPWFGSHGELRGGGPFTDPALARPGYRNFYLPHRRDPFAGLRTARQS